MTYKFTYKAILRGHYGSPVGGPITVSVLAEGPLEASQEVEKILPKKMSTDVWDIETVAIEVQA